MNAVSIIQISFHNMWSEIKFEVALFVCIKLMQITNFAVVCIYYFPDFDIEDKHMQPKLKLGRVKAIY